MISCFVSFPGLHSSSELGTFLNLSLKSVGLSQIVFTEITAHPLKLFPEPLSGGSGHAYHFILSLVLCFLPEQIGEFC